MSQWIEIANIADLDLNEGESLQIELEDNDHNVTEIVIVKSANNEWLAFKDVCSHDNASLEGGKINLHDCSVECPRHGAKFDMKTGKATRMPAVNAIPVYETKVEQEKLYLKK